MYKIDLEVPSRRISSLPPLLRTALGLNEVPRVAFVGSGGKTTALFQLAREYPPPVIVTTTAHLEFFQTKLADQHFYCDEFFGRDQNPPLDLGGVTLFSGPKNGRSVAGLEADSLHRVLSLARANRAPLLIEADGSRRHPAKAPAAHEPPIPDFVDTVVVVTGLSALGKPCTTEWVHRPEIYASLSGLREGDEISIEAIARVLCHPQGGLKNIPTHAKRIALLNQADTLQTQIEAKRLSSLLMGAYHTVAITSLKKQRELFNIPQQVFYEPAR